MVQKHLGERIRELREDKDLTQEECSKRFNMRKSTWSNYENLIRNPDYTTIKRISKEFNISSDYLLGIVEKKVPPLNNELITLITCYINADADVQNDIKRRLFEGGYSCE